MASPKLTKQNSVDQTQATIVKTIGEFKKKILLAEGQKKAYREDWEEERKINAEMISELKKFIKDLNSKLRFLNKPSVRNNQPMVAPPPGAAPTEVVHKVDLPPGASSVEDAVRLLDLKVIDLTKLIDLNHERYLRKQKFFNKLVDEYKTLFASKNQTKRSELSAPVPETIVEDNNTKLICHLENEIHRTSVQWMEAEHIRKKYRSIKESLMGDAENFESSLEEMEQALLVQHTELEHLRSIYEEAIEMRDTTKLVLQKQEQQANVNNKIREKQAIEFRRQVDERKAELERLERKIFSSGKTLIHQDSVGSGSGDLQTGKTELDSEPSGMEGNSVEKTFKRIMLATGATETGEVLNRFMAQREATTRLGFLRNSTETSKKDLEEEREQLTASLDAHRFADIKENEVNQEEVEKYKESISDQKKRQLECNDAAMHTMSVVASIKDNLLELLLKLREMDELTERPILKKVFQDFGDSSAEILVDEISSGQLLKMLQEALRLGLMASGQMTKELEQFGDDQLEIRIPLQSPPSVAEGNQGNPMTEMVKRTSFPTCYVNLLANRGTGAITSSPGQSAPIVGSDDEEVPSRQFLKRQAQMIMESKSRRKGFRGVQYPKKK